MTIPLSHDLCQICGFNYSWCVLGKEKRRGKAFGWPFTQCPFPHWGGANYFGNSRGTQRLVQSPAFPVDREVRSERTRQVRSQEWLTSEDPRGGRELTEPHVCAMLNGD